MFMIPKALKAVFVALAVVIGVAVPTSATSNGPTPSDVPPISHATGQQAGNATRAAGTVDAANTYVYRNYAPATSWQRPYYRLDSQMYVETEQLSVGYFYADSFFFDGGSDFGGYMGLQTQLFMPGVGNAGKGAIFAIWGAQAAQIDGSNACVISCTVVSGVENGQGFYSVHMPFNWTLGTTYRMVLTREHADWTLYSGVQAILVDDTHGQAWPMGRILIPSSWGGFSTQTIEWTEEYIPNSYASCANILVTAWRALGSTWLTSAVDEIHHYPTSSDSSVQTGTGCSNSHVTNLGTYPAGTSTMYQEVIGA